ncbi:DUF389 domain-containing protein [Halpernia frigidisoli]|uniref:Uncharacterized hydrophobic domain-containing protein n=1 Tax=Halpernia frigidisoli TaxID=1125876 RepID=A0A1I3E4S0_9FLAO|nr:DUF389 domain-containing protein [Halpernia frigidisoli]SFH93974.1 uncharacterized hydrophobic domain-containing protein [Halpernia frigidisoli]
MSGLLDYLQLHQGEESKSKVMESVRSQISFRGANLWILACAIFIASVGLNVNSTAVIIGAMLISPLMGPIVGTGFALGTYDFTLLRKSINNLLIATFVSLLVSTAYFYLSPFKEVQSELLSRTSPTIYDVLIAFFGGLVGVIAITRVEKGNPIPGVAIATALMPPICTAGYGLATGNMSYFLGAFYLYSINCFFICIATFFVVKFLKYPSALVDSKYEKRIKYGISILIVIMIVPSFYLAYNLFNQKKFTKSAEEFIQKEFDNNGYTVIYKKINYNTTPKSIDLAFLSKKFTDAEILSYNKMLAKDGIFGAKLTIRQNNTDLKSEILSEINKNDTNISEKDIALTKIRQELDNYKITDSTLLKEINILYPTIGNVSYGKIEQYPQTDSAKLQFVLVYTGQNIDENRIKTWLRERLHEKNVVLIKETEK